MLNVVLPHISASEWILFGFVLACALWVLAAAWLPGKRRDDDPPDTGDEEPELLPIAA